MKEKLIIKISKHLSLSKKERELIENSFVREEFQSNEYLLRSDKIANQFYFIVKGLVRVFHLANGKEVNTIIVADNSFVCGYRSFILRTPSIEYIQALERTLVLSISYDDMQNLYNKVRNWEKIGRIIADHNYLRMANRVLFLQMKTGKEKYLNFLKNVEPKVLQRTPSLHIASYLGITPESLSRIRKKLHIS